VEIIAGTMQHYTYLKIIMFKNNKMCLADQHICLRCRLMASLPLFSLFLGVGCVDVSISVCLAVHLFTYLKYLTFSLMVSSFYLLVLVWSAERRKILNIQLSVVMDI